MTRRRMFTLAAVLTVLAAAVAWLAPLQKPGTGPQTASATHVSKVRRMLTRREVVRGVLFEELKPVRLKNCTLERFGEEYDGGYLLCANLLDPVEAAYSYGISGYDKWGCDVSSRHHIRVHRYDCFDTRNPACPRGDAMFHAECVGSARETIDGRPFDTLANQIAANGDRGRRLVVKMDVEGAEWDSFLYTTDEVLERFDQLVVEFHRTDVDRFLVSMRRLKELFHVVHVHFNNHSCDADIEPFPAWAYEVLLVNKRIAVVDPNGTASGPNALDRPNDPGSPDCQTRD
jgi:hypothetical protein